MNTDTFRIRIRNIIKIGVPKIFEDLYSYTLTWSNFVVDYIYTVFIRKVENAEKVLLQANLVYFVNY
jgi:hypothetical protein